MKWKLLIVASAAMIALAGSMNVCAQPAVMSDGAVFDAEFYAQTYPDVVAVYGTDAGALYQHYLSYGKAEGRSAYVPDALLPTAEQATPALPDAAAALVPAKDSTAVSAVPYEAGAVWELTNAQRAAAGLAALTWDDSLWAAASVRAQEASILFSHTRPDGTPCFTVFPAGLHLRTMGENIAIYQRTPQEVMNDWMLSESHRVNILDPEFTRIGVGYYVDAAGHAYWAQLFGG